MGFGKSELVGFLSNAYYFFKNNLLERYIPITNEQLISEPFAVDFSLILKVKW